MRQRSGCKACRERHIKCVKLRESDKCKYCTERKRPCIRGNAFRFRNVTSVKYNAGEDIGSAEQSLEFRSEQTWVNIPNSLHFVTPNTDGDEEEFEAEPDLETDPVVQPESAHDDSDGASKPREPDVRLDEASGTDRLPSYQDQTVFTGIPVPVLNDTSDLPSIHDVLSTNLSPPINAPSSGGESKVVQTNRLVPSISQLGGRSNWQASPILHRPSQSPSVSKRSPFAHNNHQSPYNSSAFSPSVGPTLKWPINSAYEARLLHHYLCFCTGWIDVCDKSRLFANEVPKRAAHFPVILNGILGLAARHVWLMGKVNEDWSQPYVDECLKSLIVALEDPLAHWDENFLIAVILLRLHEEMGESDEHCHHFGTARILNSISSFAADGGLREASSWVSLRQHIYVSLTTQQPLNLSLDNYRHSSVFTDFDDESWANRIIFLFATVLQAVFGDTNTASEGVSREIWKDLSDEVDEWERTKPWGFSAFHVEPDAGERFDGHWPELLCPKGVVAVGLQYYHLCKILLTIYSPNASLVGLAGVRARKATDAAIRKHIRITIGYGVSNSSCENAMFQGSHVLSACGAYVIDPREQQACVEYLQQLQSKMGWRTDGVLRDLREYVFTANRSSPNPLSLHCRIMPFARTMDALTKFTIQQSRSNSLKSI